MPWESTPRRAAQTNTSAVVVACSGPSPPFSSTAAEKVRRSSARTRTLPGLEVGVSVMVADASWVSG